MSLTLPLLLTAALGAAPDGLGNLDFRTGRLVGWQGHGFYLTTASGHGPSRSFGVCSSDSDQPGRTGLLHRTFVLPQGAGSIHFTASATPAGGRPDDRLDVYLEAARREIIPKLVRTAKGYERTGALLPPLNGRPREYVWPVAGRVGDTLRIVVVDRNADPGRHVFCSGFRIAPVDQFEAGEFSRHMNGLARTHSLAPMGPRYRSKHFLAVSNTAEAFTRMQLERCELLYDLFWSHFRAKGFRLQRPPTRLMVALFDAPEGMDAYIGQRMPAAIAGLYHPPSNRLVVYDYGRNRGLLFNKDAGQKFAGTLRTDLERQIVRDTIERCAGEMRADANVAALMHEAAHQMSFNTGMLNRAGDQALWLAEGLATYCEATEQGYWKGMGAPNPERLRLLAAALGGQLKVIPLRSLLESDAWLHGPGAGQRAAIGYAQSWALFRMLIKEQPRALKRYLELIYPRRTSEHRLADFVQVFGADVAKLEKRHHAYIKRVVEANR